MATNPYQPPSTPLGSGSGRLLPNGWVPCPECGGTDVKMQSVTLWGGAIGQRLLSHVKCGDCKTGYNAKSGGSNTLAIVAYQAVTLGLLVGLLILVNS